MVLWLYGTAVVVWPPADAGSGRLDGPGKMRYRSVDHGVGRRQRETEITGHLEGAARQNDHPCAGQPLGEVHVVRDGRTAQHVERRLRQVDLVALLGEGLHHAVALALSVLEVDRDGT